MSRVWPIAVVVILGLVDAPALVAQTSPKAAMLEQVGWRALAAGDAQTAADAFREAIALDPHNPHLLLGAGTAAFLQRRDADAKDALEHALQLDPKLTRARAQLGQLLRRLDDLEGAIRAYERVVKERPSDTTARETLERWQREWDLHNRMQLAVGDHFMISFEGPEDAALATHALESLDRAFWRICEQLGSFPTSRINVVLYSTEQFRDITRSPPWATGVYDGTIRVPMKGALDKSTELDRVLAHEFTHALIRSLASRGVPAWLNEGLATALESSEGVEWAHARLRRASKTPMLQDLRNSFGRLEGDDARLAYAASAVAVRRILDTAGGSRLMNLIRDLGQGADFETAFHERMQLSYADFQASLFSH